MLGKIKGRRRGQQSTDAWMNHRLNGHDFKQTQEMVRDRKIWCAAVHGLQIVGHDLATEQQQVLHYWSVQLVHLLVAV